MKISVIRENEKALTVKELNDLLEKLINSRVDNEEVLVNLNLLVQSKPSFYTLPKPIKTIDDVLEATERDNEPFKEEDLIHSHIITEQVIEEEELKGYFVSINKQ